MSRLQLVHGFGSTTASRKGREYLHSRGQCRLSSNNIAQLCLEDNEACDLRIILDPRSTGRCSQPTSVGHKVAGDNPIYLF
jgi:hypothetical protein